MIYAAKTKATDGALTVGGIDGKLQNDVLAFDTKAEYGAKVDELFAQGDNLIRIPQKRVVAEFGRNFEVLPNGLVGREGLAEMFTDEEIAAM